MVTGVVHSPPWFLPSIFIAHRVQQSHCSSIFHRVLLTHALALSASQYVPKIKPPRNCTNIHSGGFELTKLTYTRLEDNPTRHRGDRPDWHLQVPTRYVGFILYKIPSHGDHRNTTVTAERDQGKHAKQTAKNTVTYVYLPGMIYLEIYIYMGWASFFPIGRRI